MLILHSQCSGDDVILITLMMKVKKGKDVNLYSTFHVQDTSTVHLVTDTEPPGRI